MKEIILDNLEVSGFVGKEQIRLVIYHLTFVICHLLFFAWIQAASTGLAFQMSNYVK